MDLNKYDKKIKEIVSDLTEEDMTHIVRFACTAASLSTQKHGGITSVPDIKQIHSLLNNK